MAKKKYCYDYPRPAVTVDLVIVTTGVKPSVLLVRRKADPYADCWALPGGFVEMDEDLETAARRELREETGIEVGDLAQIRTFGAPGRDPRGRTITVAYLARVERRRVKPQAGDDAAETRWFPLHALPSLAFDHDEILAWARERHKNESA